MESGLVASFMEVTSCGSQAAALRHLASCDWRLEAAIDLYFAAGADADDPVRAPIPALSDTLYEYEYDDDDPYAASSSTARAAPSVWTAPGEPPYPTSVPPVHVQVPSLPEVRATGWESYGDDGNNVKEEINGMDADEEDGMGAEEQDSYYGTEAEEGSDKEQDDGDYMKAGKGSEKEQDNDDMVSGYSDSDDGMEAALVEQSPPPRPRAEKTLKELFRPPYELMYTGSFHDAKVHSARQDRWLLMSLQARDEFESNQHNRDLWENEVVAQVVKRNFVFSLLEKTGHHGDEGGKVCCFYKLEDDQLPAVLVLDPITGQMLDKWCGAIHPDDFLTSIGKYTESNPSTLSKPKIVQRTTATPELTSESADARSEQEPAMPKSAAPDAQEPAPVPKIEAPAVMVVDDEQPMEGEKIYKLRVRSPSGNVVTKEFGSKRRVAVLFAYCRSVVHDQAGTEQAFRIMRLAGSALEELRDDGASFEDLGLNCTTVSVVLDN